MNQLRGVFITIEGIEGVGKSTALQFLHHRLQTWGISHVVSREPGGTPIAEAIRKVLLYDHSEPMCLETELLLLFAARAQNMTAVIKPALERGQWVISDRFTDASFAYQGRGRGMDLNRIADLAHWVQGGLEPDFTLLLDATVSQALFRLRKRKAKDRFEQEQEDFFERVRYGYLERAAAFPERFIIISADQPLPQVQQQLTDILQLIIEKFPVVSQK